MAANSDTTVNQDLEDMKNLAIEQQHCFYENLDDCMTYQPDEHKYLKQNIGYALYGPPENENTENNIRCNAENQSEDADITDAVDYKNKTLIDKIYNKICEYTIGTDGNKSLYFAIIYNVTVCPRPKNLKKKEGEAKKKEGAAKKKEGETKKKEGEVKKKDENNYVAIPIPIFKIWRDKTIDTTKKKKKTTEKSMNMDEEYEIWYIDSTCRIYKDWTDYKTHNNLFKCTMVLPKDGLYQPDPSCPITEDYSTVWLEIMDSPACSLKSLVCDGVDIASTVTGAGALIVGTAAMFTPLAPAVVVAGAVTGGASALWAMARGTHQLVDRSIHEESINPLDREAFPQWLTITGSAFGLGAMGGTAVISTAVSRGMTVNTAARIAFNTVQGGNLFFNGAGIIYQGYCMVDKYRTDQTVDYFDVLSLATHLMFFAGTVVKIQFAGDIIRSNQGKILDDYRDNLRNKRLRNKYNRIKRRAAANNTCKMSENAEVIRYINHRNQLSSNAPSTSTTVNKMADSSKFSRIKWTIEDGILKINGVKLLEPSIFVLRLIQSGIPTDLNEDNTSDSQDYASDLRITTLWSVLDTLFSQYKLCTNNRGINTSETINTSEFIPLLREMDSLNVDQNLLEKLFNIAIGLVQCSGLHLNRFLLKAMRFIWLYCKRNLQQWGLTTCLRMRSIAGFNILRMIITALFEAGNIDALYLAFEKYVMNFSN